MSQPQDHLQTAIGKATDEVADRWLAIFQGKHPGPKTPAPTPATPAPLPAQVDPFSIADALVNVQAELGWPLRCDVLYYFYAHLTGKYLPVDYNAASDLLIALCEQCNRWIENKSRRERSFPPEVVFEGLRQCVDRCRGPKDSGPTAEHLVQGFILLCESVGYVGLPPYLRKTLVGLNATFFDFEYLRSCLFGLWSAIPGLNDLFGGGGPYFFSRSSGQPGRLFVVEGGIGQGKSTFALSLASDIVRKGGFSWVIPFEQTCEECRRTIKDLNLIPDSYKLSLRERRAGVAAPGTEEENRNCLLLVRGTKDTYEAVFSEIFRIAAATPPALPKCVVIDPFNAIVEKEDASAELRDELLKLIETAKGLGIHIIIVTETEKFAAAGRVEIIEKLADVVVRLTRANPLSGYTQRFIEVVKSRKQREQRGAHPYSIGSGTGVQIFPSSAAVAARIRNRRTQSAVTARFGWSPVDDLLGERAMFRGDVLVFRGPVGTLKTELSMVFCMSLPSGQSWKKPRGAIFVPLKDSASASRSMMERRGFFQPGGSGDGGLLDTDRITVLELPPGYIAPGVFFRRLEQCISGMRSRGFDVERIVFDNTEHWDMNCPFIAQDPTFASTLMDFTRRFHITCLFVCHTASEEAPVEAIEQSIIAAADVAFDFFRYDFAGHQRVAFRVVTSRSMEHDGDYYDLAMIDGKLEVGVRAKQLRLDQRGGATAVPIHFFLHEEGHVQSLYNQELTNSLKPILTPDVKLHSEDRTQVTRWLGLNSYSSVDYLQILQLDEFQIPLTRDVQNRVPEDFHELKFDVRSSKDTNMLRLEIAPDLIARVSIVDPKNPNRFFAMPYYQNLGMLVVRQDKAGSVDTDSWNSILGAYRDWLTSHPKTLGSSEVFFDFSCDKHETYISLFFEMAMGSGIPKCQEGESLANWLDTHKERTKQCLRDYAFIAHQAHQAHPGQAAIQPTHKGDVLGDGPVVWRHWFTTACAMFENLPSKCWPSLGVALLPQEASVAGEWYLTLPGCSAAPEFGAEIIKQILAKDEEFDRFQRGVGLPVRQSFYDAASAATDQLRCRYFSLPATAVKKALSGALRRSGIRDYRSVSRIFVFHLKQLLESDQIWIENEEQKKQFDAMFDNMIRDLQFFGNTGGSY